MGNRRYHSDGNASFMERTLEPLSNQTIAEIAGDRRVLVENHCGVKAYSRENIQINVKFGTLCVNGGDLEIIKMTKAQLIISGNIDAVSIQRRKLC